MKFQIERIALFTDAVFAIVITLMMIEIKAPHLEHHATFSEHLETLLKMTNIFIGTILSFLLIGMFWIRHHRLMKYMSGYTNTFLWLNICFLLSVAFIPFSTSFVFENANVSSLPLLVYNLNYIIATVLEYKLYKYVLNPKNQMQHSDASAMDYNLKAGLLFPIGIYVLVSLIAILIDPSIAPIGYAAFGFSGLVMKKKKSVVVKAQEV